jgi:hypothetical protein
MPAKLTNLVGKKYRMLTVESFVKMDGYRRSIWRCKCDCGGTKDCIALLLKINRVTNCGCLTEKSNLSHTKLYKVRSHMLSRCYNKKDKSYVHYGARGIDVCERWRNSAVDFYNDLISSYKEGLQIDRVDNNKGYHPDNVRWATRSEQMLNRRPFSEWDFKSKPFTKRESNAQ